jgi:hypothetical protein
MIFFGKLVLVPTNEPLSIETARGCFVGVQLAADSL